MYKKTNSVYLLFLSVLVFAGACGNASRAETLSQDRNITVGVVSDGPSIYFDSLTQQIKSELRALVGSERNLKFKHSPSFNAQWDIDRVEGALNSALADSEVDIVLAMGVLVTEATLYETETFPKPVVGGCFQDADTAGLPYDKKGLSTKHNLNFVVTPLRSSRDIEVFKEVVKFKNVHILVDEVFLKGMKDIAPYVETVEARLGVTISIVPMGRDPEKVLSGLRNNVEAVYLTPPLRMTEKEKQVLIDGLIALKLPSFSMLGHSDVEEGIMAGIAPDIRRRMSRRIALNIQQILMGVQAHELSVLMPVEEKLLLNGATFEKIGFSPDFNTLLTADFVNMELVDKGHPLTLKRAVDTALKSNVDLSVQKEEVAGSLSESRQAFSIMMPQVSASYNYNRIDSDRARASMGFQPRYRSSAGVSVEQMIFDDPLISSYRASDLNYQKALFEDQAVRLDVVETVANNYVQLLLTKALYRIEVDNLKLTQHHLQLAKMRRDAGAAGPSEVLRWEAQEAMQKSSAIDAEAIIGQARITLNQSLGVDQHTRWDQEEIELSDDAFYFLEGTLEKLVTNEAELFSLREFFIQEAFNNSPSLKAVDSLIQAQQIVLDQKKRRFFTPSVFATFSYDRIFKEEFTGPRIEDQFEGAGIPASAFPSQDKNEWVLGVTVSLPLFEGGGRFHDVGKAAADLRKLESARERARQLIEQRVQTILYGMESSYPAIQLRRLSADRARKNLNLIRESYAKGAVSILDLLDGQNEAYVAGQSAVMAAYTYLQDVINCQRAISWFEILKSREEKSEFAARLEAFVKKLSKNP